MEKFALTLQSPDSIKDYLAENHLMRYEQEILAEIAGTIENRDAKQLAWFAVLAIVSDRY
ncbi:hypothetical protein [Mucilaginibacter sp. SP1R1]|uniref:hypothetical protein n=1 Tax=Mucilaginibacter sp. SP1R1 TaxID=2723091 RepID=UPI001611F61B|nr:hypothetical protein [Mucilaginibacter sp. SP1R1]MBB6152711.1 hypothetical protein [Mucilaginibacter sp. SP1R1]